MNISHYPVDSNTAILFAIQGTNQSEYLQPDYFLSSSNNSFLGKKYHKVQQRISRIISAALLSGLVLTASVDASASSNTEVSVFPYMQNHGTYDHLTPDHTFEAVVKQKSLVRRAAHKVAKRLGFSNSSLKSRVDDTSCFDQPHFTAQSDSSNQPSISYDEVKAIYESEYGESIDEAMSKRVERNETISDILKRTLAIRERELAKRELTNTLDAFSDTASVTSSSGISEMSSDSNSGNSGSTSDEHIWQDPDIEIEQVFAEEFSSRVVDQTLDTSVSCYSGSDTASNSDISSPDSLSMNGSFDFAVPSDDLEHSDTAQNNLNNIHDTILTDTQNDTFATSHNAQNWEWDTEWDDSDDDTVYTSHSEYSDSDSEYPNSDSEYDVHSDQENDSETYTNFVSSKNVDLPLPPPQVQKELASLNAFEEREEGRNFDTAVTKTQEKEAVTIASSNELQVSAVQANIAYESEVSEPANHNTLLAVAEIELAISDMETELAISDTTNDLDNTALDIAGDVENDNVSITEQQVILPITTQTASLDQETLLKKAKALSYISHEELRVARKVASNHIKQRMFGRSMLVAVAAGDESALDQSQILGYSVWSSGVFGTAKQKTSNNLHGYSSKILGGSIGADVKFENDLLLGTSFSKIRSNIKHASQKVTKKLNTYIASIYGTSPIKDNLTLGVIGSAVFSPKPRSKLLSLESHLDYQIALPQEITLIPNISFKYEYERSKTYQEQIDSNISIAHAKKSYQALSTEIGSRVIFAPIKLADIRRNEGAASSPILSTLSITPTAHFSVERRIGSRGASNPLTVTYQELGQTIWAGSLPTNAKTAKTSLNAGIGLIASHKNIKLELLYDHTRQKRFKAHQGMLKLKVNL